MVQISYTANGYPHYPKEVAQFMLSLSRAPWCHRWYTANQANKESISTATMIDLCEILTTCSRGERFSDGHWKHVLKGDVIEKVIARAKVLTAQVWTDS